ncbi:MAG: aminoglycoside phosphotransferase [Candidatus Dormibacteraeota bacterium]|uniref:Maltokinase n=1 Tax=Candidatus Aeolococcus gillhamiae TaxID=3127015 RepID=A0A934N4M6_9BACT|nr:aminoglycoside phosphotransferase [Candidatus Dormibacteraeota bacterium]
MNGTVDVVRGVLEEGLATWLPRQRWYGGGRAIRGVHCEELSTIADEPEVALCVARVDHEDDTHTTYNVPVAVGSPGGLRPSDPAAIIHEDERTLIFDALADARTAAPLWRILAGGQAVQLRDGRLGVGGDGGLDPSTRDIAPLAREQSNTSLIVGGEHLLKVMRKLAFEPSVELEMTRALEAAGFNHLAPPEAWLHYERNDQPHGALLALAQQYLRNGTEGWTLALTSLRDLYADAEDLNAGDAFQRNQAVEDAGGSFTPDAARLGDITAQMHLALADARGAELSAQPITPALLAEWADEMIGDLEALIAGNAAAVQGIGEHEAAIEARINAIRTVHDPGLAIRIHGDYHLGQVLRTDSGWTVLDFEGEPRRPVEHRRRRHSPLRDVAGMLRSFDYAASVALIERSTPADPAWGHLWAHGRTWAAANREAFWATYVERTAGSRLLPDAGAALTLRRAFEIQKAVYEVGYELAHRPQWVSVPLGFLLEATA